MNAEQWMAEALGSSFTSLEHPAKPRKEKALWQHPVKREDPMTTRHCIETLVPAMDTDFHSLSDLLIVVSRETGIDLNDIRSPRRNPRTARARFLFYFMARKLTIKSLPQIGRFISRHHSSVIHGCNMVAKNYSLYRATAERVEAALSPKVVP